MSLPPMSPAYLASLDQCAELLRESCVEIGIDLSDPKIKEALSFMGSTIGDALEEGYEKGYAEAVTAMGAWAIVLGGGLRPA